MGDGANILAGDMAVDVQKTGLVLEYAGVLQDAADRLARNGHDVCLIDCQTCGEEALKIVKTARARGHTAPIILLVGRDNVDFEAQAAAVGVWDCLDKRQLTPARLEWSVRYALAHSRIARALQESEERLTLALRATRDGVWDWNLETDAVWYSPSYQAMLGYTEGELEQHVSAWKRLLHPEDKTRALEIVEAVRRNGREYHMEFRLRHKGGHYLEILSRGFPVRREATGPVTRIVGIHVDQSERKRDEAALKRTSDYFHSVLDSSPDIIISSNQDRRIMVFNPAAERAMGYSADEVIGRPVQMLYAKPEEACRVHESIQSTGLFEGEIVHRTKSGATFIAQLEASLLCDAQGNPVGVMGISRDITEHKRAEAKRAGIARAMRKHHEDLLLILDQLPQAIVLTDHEGRVTYANKSCEHSLGRTAESAMGGHWTEMCPFQPAEKAALKAMAARPRDERSKLHVRVGPEEGHQRLMEVDILDDPRDGARKICFFQDLTEMHDLRRKVNKGQGARHLDGGSLALQSIHQQILDLAAVGATVLIEGETGTGKERVAQAIHAAGPRSNRACIPVNCAGLTESLIGSQLFGHKRGAFTGAVADHRGVFETANGGTVFLDEIGDLPLGMQTNLLRVLQEREITRLGESTPRRIDVRVIAATHQDLDELVRIGKFRKDLLYRIRVARITIPPLRDRRDDIPVLVDVFLRETAQRINKPPLSVSDEAMRKLVEYDWPGNVREVQSAIESACIASKGPVIQVEALPPELLAPRTLDSSATASPEDPRARLLAALRAASGRRTTAARLLGISRATFYRRLQELRVCPDSVL